MKRIKGEPSDIDPDCVSHDHYLTEFKSTILLKLRTAIDESITNDPDCIKGRKKTIQVSYVNIIFLIHDKNEKPTTIFNKVFSPVFQYFGFFTENFVFHFIFRESCAFLLLQSIFQSQKLKKHFLSFFFLKCFTSCSWITKRQQLIIIFWKVDIKCDSLSWDYLFLCGKSCLLWIQFELFTFQFWNETFCLILNRVIQR